MRAFESHTIHSVADGACGDGSLLLAAESHFTNITCRGVDIDISTVRQLRNKHPHWLVSTADMLNPRSRNAIPASKLTHDAVLLNPPFSLHTRKFVTETLNHEPIKCSIAMAHILANISTFKPRHGLSAIVPESLMYSETDHAARQALSHSHTIRITKELRNTTFSGARANSLILHVTPKSELHPPEPHLPLIWPNMPTCIVTRGGLPLHEAQYSRGGIPLIHSTDISLLGLGRLPKRNVRPIRRGQVTGIVVLLPRVGLPTDSAIRVHCLSRNAQLSDCVIALAFSSKQAASTLVRALRTDHKILQRLYRGTGARYVTISRLVQTLVELGARPQVDDASS
ncbi:hypothetical protein HUW62_03910 [Myxococcus sp. AM011]|nr:hypothetical protein [Myxococcus sp. AM011]